MHIVVLIIKVARILDTSKPPVATHCFLALEIHTSSQMVTLHVTGPCSSTYVFMSSLRP